jgi:hypothetical protein
MRAMNQSLNSPESDAEASALSNSWVAWERYYQQASRRRRAMGGARNLREEKRRRRLRENVAMAASTALVGGLTLIFYLVLSR